MEKAAVCIKLSSNHEKKVNMKMSSKMKISSKPDGLTVRRITIKKWALLKIYLVTNQHTSSNFRLWPAMQLRWGQAKWKDQLQR